MAKSLGRFSMRVGPGPNESGQLQILLLNKGTVYAQQIKYNPASHQLCT